MNSVIFRNIIRFIVLVLLQIYVLNNINFFGHINPYLYILFILLLPLDIPKWLLLVLAFFIGFTIDYFSNTIGLNIAASVFIAFLRPGLIKLLSPKSDPEPGMQIGIRDFGFRWFFVYTFILAFIHHIILFYLEIFRFNEFFETFRRAFLSALISLLLILLSQFLFYKPKK